MVGGFRRAQEFIAARIRRESRGFGTPCWVWQAHRTEKGYGRAIVPGIGRVRVHRATHLIATGQPIPDGYCIDHLCRVTACCNPSHLEVVTIAENTARGNRERRGGTINSANRRSRDYCINGHPNIPENRQPCGNCRPCSIEAAQRHRAKRNAGLAA